MPALRVGFSREPACERRGIARFCAGFPDAAGSAFLGIPRGRLCAEFDVPTLHKAGRYELLEELGRGAMGVVYKAYDPVIGRAVAVKTLRLSEQGTGMTRADLIARFQTEARAAGLLAHSNIVVVYDVGEDEGLFYIIMELVEGRSLQALLDARQSFPLPRVLRLMEQACSALEYAHQRNVVHRDIKPANLMLMPDDTVKITDFGTAKILQFGTVQTAHVIGTPSYMSPEQVKGKPVDGRSDIFSLGVILYELVTGEKPFPGQNITTVIYKIINEDPIPPRELDSSVHPGLSYVITRALAKDPEARYANCREFMEALRNYRERSDTAEATSAMPQPSAAMARPAGVAAATQLTKKPGSVWLALLLLAIIAVAGHRVWPYVREVWQYGRATPVNRAPATQSQPPASPASAPSETSGQPQPAPGAVDQAPAKPAEAKPGVPPAAQAPVPGKTKEARAEQRAAVGWVLVHTDPPGAEILVDDAATGQRTPARLELSPGEHTLAVSLSGYAVARRTIMVDPGQTVLANMTLH